MFSPKSRSSSDGGSVSSPDWEDSAAFESFGGELQQEDETDNQQVMEDCLALVQSTDYIMEPQVYDTLSSYFSTGGDPQVVVEHLSTNYTGLAQICNLMGDWLVELGDSPAAVQEVFECHLSALITKHFNPKTADKIFESQNEEHGGKIDWLSDMTHHYPWRRLIFRLAVDYQECLMLNFAVKLISDAGYQHEISNVNTAAQQLEIYKLMDSPRVLCNAVDGVLKKIPGTTDFKNNLQEFVRVSCHSEYTYLYTQCLLHLLTQQEHNAKGGAAAATKYLGQTLRLAAQGSIVDLWSYIEPWLECLIETEGLGSVGSKLPGVPLYPPIVHSGLDDYRPSSVYVSGSGVGCNPALIQALFSMLSKKTLNPADMSLLYNWYSNTIDPPPIDLIRDPIFIDLLIDALFGTRGTRLHPDHRHKYVFLLAYASSVAEYTKKTPRKSVFNRDEVKPTEEAVEKMADICQGRSDTASTDILAELPAIYQALKFPVVAAGVLHWVKSTVTEVDYFQLHPEPVPIHLALLDEIATLHHLLHEKVFHLLTMLFNQTNAAATEGAGEVLLERQRTFIDRLIHLLSVGYALPVTEFMASKFQEGATDTSLIRYFVTETLEIISPPYSSEFVERFLPLVENKDIVDEDVLDRMSAAQEFIEKCHN